MAPKRDREEDEEPQVTRTGAGPAEMTQRHVNQLLGSKDAQIEALGKKVAEMMSKSEYSFGPPFFFSSLLFFQSTYPFHQHSS
jgi:hypothetical protein